MYLTPRFSRRISRRRARMFRRAKGGSRSGLGRLRSCDYNLWVKYIKATLNLTTVARRVYFFTLFMSWLFTPANLGATGNGGVINELCETRMSPANRATPQGRWGVHLKEVKGAGGAAEGGLVARDGSRGIVRKGSASLKVGGVIGSTGSAKKCFAVASANWLVGWFSVRVYRSFHGVWVDGVCTYSVVFTRELSPLSCLRFSLFFLQFTVFFSSRLSLFFSAVYHLFFSPFYLFFCGLPPFFLHDFLYVHCNTSAFLLHSFLYFFLQCIT